MATRSDVALIGSTAGGGILGYALAPTGKKILILERGGILPREQENWDPTEVFSRTRYKTKEIWHDRQGRMFHSSMYYYVGGNTKVYGAAHREDTAGL